MTPPLQVLDGTLEAIPEPLRAEKGAAALFNPCGLAVSADGAQVFIADTGHHRICMLEDGMLRVLAGSGARGYADGKGAEAAFAHPCGLALDSEGTLYVADCGRPACQTPRQQRRSQPPRHGMGSYSWAQGCSVVWTRELGPRASGSRQRGCA